ncbi:D-2-hydroxyacid dehydrogenase [Aneurinibacillus terranovensis]|uniref:D-2-hydroxyacid dehydrogenase n=1 Tax=Aneurinibacillus terranovensis TaxID=278991 RepID=UPI0004151A86|nr:D-2-hydroxyacid dehydrogenase [Aneurinibacillus terranovensis]
MKIVSTAKMSSRHQKTLTERFPHHTFYFYENIHEAKDDITDAEIVVTYGEDLTGELIETMQRLTWIQVLSAGLDKMPLPSLAEKGILVTNAKGIHKIPMAEYTIGVMLQVARELNVLYEKQKNREWNRTLRVQELYGKTLGIIGVGAIGEEIAIRAKAFGMNVIGISRSGTSKPGCDEMYKQDDVLTVLPACDYIVVVVPLTRETHHLIGRNELLAMKQTAVLINIARGEVVDEEALTLHLQEKKIKAAVLDVFSEEPLPESSPLWGLENCIVTPHLSGRSPFYMERALEIFHHNLNAFDKGQETELLNRIDCSKGY